MPILSQPSFGPRTALAYVTGGALIDVWTLVWYFTRDAELTRTGQFWVIGLVLTGLTFVILGLLLGPLGRSARQVELPPVGSATRAEAAIQQTAAANPAPVVASAGAAPATTPGMSVPANTPGAVHVPAMVIPAARPATY